MANKKTVSILGAGAMGWGIGYIISTYGKANVIIWDRNLELVEEMAKTRKNVANSDSAIVMPSDVLITNDLTETDGSDVVLLAVPSFAVREMCEKISGFKFSSLLMISKGMEKETCLLPFQVARELLPKINILHLTGAGYGKEVHLKIPVAETLASDNETSLKEMKELLETDWLTIKPSTDLLGVQLAGAMKNVMVIGIGLAENGQEDQNLRKALIDECVREMTLLGDAMNARKETFEGPAGRGDLEISAHPSSRNYKLGQSLAQKGIAEVEADLKRRKVTVEGFHTAYAVYQLSKKYLVNLPIIEEVYRVIYEGKDPKESVNRIIS
ncbi:MAG: NAD(P)H-dependent glycerol-3-phosphate dehydrogenase [Candidatus Pacebacteria bacterium]|nr:NAD(P)H-dependent glycerol-3-phosphate dehydrogenase [Candidatus Paceibacterota bacterium]